MPSTRVQDFDVLETIRSGSIGNVRVIRRIQDDKIFAWTELDLGIKTRQDTERLDADMQKLLTLKHPHINRHHDWIVEKETGTVFLIMDYDHFQLSEMVQEFRNSRKRFTEDMVWFALHELLLAVQVCQRHAGNKAWLLYKDLTTENVYIDHTGHMKLVHYGPFRLYPRGLDARRGLGSVKKSLPTSAATTESLSAKEMRGEAVVNHGHRLDHSRNILSLGRLMYEICTLEPYSPHQQLPQCYSAELCAVINSMLRSNYKVQPSVENLLNTPMISMLQRCWNRRMRIMKLKSGKGKTSVLDDIKGRFEKEREEKLRNLIYDAYDNQQH